MVTKSVIDIGSNTVKLFIAELEEGTNTLSELACKRRMALLAKKLHKTGMLSEKSMEKALEHIEDYIKMSEVLGVERNNIFVTATAACRNASNGKEFIQDIKEKYHLENIKILSGEEEARFTYLGVMESVEAAEDEPLCVIDIGGGSFQLSTGTKNNFDKGVSVPKGGNIITEMFGLKEPSSKEVIEEAITYIRMTELKGLELPTVNAKLIGAGGTIKIMQLMLRESNDYSDLTVEELRNTAYKLRDMSIEERNSWFIEKYPNKKFRHNAGLTLERAEVIVAGLCIIIGLAEKLQAEKIAISTTDAKNYIIKLDTLGD